MDRERLIDLLEAVRSVRTAIFRMEQGSLAALTEEQVRDLPESRGGNASDGWFTPAELGAWLKVSRTTSYRLVREGRIPAYRIGRTTRVRAQNFAANAAGMLSPVFIGVLLGTSNGSYVIPLVVAGGISIVGALSYLLVMGKVEPLPASSEQVVPDASQPAR